MQFILLLLMTAAMSFDATPANTLVCLPAGYAQSSSGVLYERVDCVASRQSNPQCSEQSYDVDQLKVGALTYTTAQKLPQDGDYQGRIRLSIDRATGDYKLVVIATARNSPGWKNVKTFWGKCAKPNLQFPL